MIYKRKNIDAQKADEFIKYCFDCNNCWEINTTKKGLKKIIYYKNFVKFGKQKQICDICKGEKNNVKNGIHSILDRK